MSDIPHARCRYPTVEDLAVNSPEDEILSNAASDSLVSYLIYLRRCLITDANRIQCLVVNWALYRRLAQILQFENWSKAPFYHFRIRNTSVQKFCSPLVANSIFSLVIRTSCPTLNLTLDTRTRRRRLLASILFD